MFSKMRFFRAVEITACDISDCSSEGRKEVAEFYSMFYIREGIASGKHVAQTMTNQRRLVERWWKGRLKIGQTKRRTLRLECVFYSFDSLCYVNSKLTATAAGGKSSPSLSEREYVTTQDTVLSIRGEVGVVSVLLCVH